MYFSSYASFGSVYSGTQSLGQTGEVVKKVINGKEISSPVLNGFGKNFMKATMLVAGGLSSTIAGGKFIDGLKQGLITSGLNHLAHLGAAAIEEGKTNRQIKTAIVNDCGEDYLNQPVTENTLKDMAIVFKEIYESGAKDYAFATEENLFGNLELTGGQLSSDGLNANGVTNMFTGKVLFSPNLLGTNTMLNFAATWYHESIHSFYAVSGFFINTMKLFKNSGLSYDDAVQSAINVSETIAHLQTQNYGLGIVFPTPVKTIRNYGHTYLNFLNLK